MGLDERLREEFERAARPADPTGVYDDLIGRRERRRIARRIRVGALTVAVALGCVVGVVVLSRVFATNPVDPAAGGGQGILFGDVVDDGSDLFLVQSDGSGLRRLTNDGASAGASWSPDGTQIVFARYDEQTQTSDLFVMDPAGSEITRLTDTPDLSESAPRWSPDGSRIAFESTENDSAGVYVMDADGSNVERLTDPDTDSGSPDWAPDGSQLVFHVTPTPAADGPGGIEIWIMDADGGDPHLIVGDGVSGNYEPRWSPDGESIVFTRDRDVYVVLPDGTGLTNLTPESGTDFYDRDPAWSSDGTRIVFASTRSFEDGHSLFTMNVDGSDVQPVIDRAIGFCCPRPDWQGDAAAAPSPEPSLTEEPTPDGEDLGLGFSVCNVTSVEGRFVPGVDGAAFVATRAGASGGCPDPGEQILAVDVTGDGRADTSFEPLKCDPFCAAFAAPDVDGDGTDEVLVQNVPFTIAGVKLFELQLGDGGTSLGPVTVPPPGSTGFQGGTEPQFWVGGDAGNRDALRCEPFQGRRALVSTTALVPVDAPGDAQVTETWFFLEGYELRVVDVREYTAPVNDDFQPYQQTGGCGADLDPYG